MSLYVIEQKDKHTSTDLFSHKVFSHIVRAVVVVEVGIVCSFVKRYKGLHPSYVAIDIKYHNKVSQAFGASIAGAWKAEGEKRCVYTIIDRSSEREKGLTYQHRRILTTASTHLLLHQAPSEAEH